MSTQMQEAPPEAQAAAQGGSYPTQSDPAMQLFSKAADLIQQGLAVEPDPQIKAAAAKLLAGCHALAAQGEKGHDQALGLSPALKMIQRKNALSQQGGGDQGQSGY